MPSQPETVKLPFKGLVLSSEDRLVTVLELPGLLNQGPGTFLVLTDKSVNTVPMPRFKFMFQAMQLDTIQSYPLDCLTGVDNTSSKHGFRWLMFERGNEELGSILIPNQSVGQVLPSLNAVLTIFHGNELVGLSKDRFSLRPVDLGEDRKQKLLTQIATMRDECIRKYTDPRFVNRLHRMRIVTFVFNTLMLLGVTVLGVIFLMEKCSQK